MTNDGESGRICGAGNEKQASRKMGWENESNCGTDRDCVSNEFPLSSEGMGAYQKQASQLDRRTGTWVIVKDRGIQEEGRMEQSGKGRAIEATRQHNDAVCVMMEKEVKNE